MTLFPPDLPARNAPQPDMPDSYGYESSEPEPGSPIRRYIAAIWRQRWLIVLFAVIGTGVGYALNRVVKPTYEAQASIQIPFTSRGFVAPNPLRSAPLFEGRGWLELLRSFEVLDEVVRQRRLFLEPALIADTQYLASLELGENFVPGEYLLASAGSGRLRLSRADESLVEEATVGDSLGRAVGLRWVPPAIPAGRVVSFRVRVPRDAAVRLGNELITQLPPDGALLRMALRGQDPQVTASTLNAVVLRFVEVATLLKREKLSAVTEMLRDQLESARVDMTNAESSLEQFQVNTITLPSDRGATPIATGLAETRDPVRQAFFQLRLDREDLIRDRDAIQRALATRGDTARSIVVALGTIPAVRASTELLASLELLTDKRSEARQLRLAFSESHPPLRDLVRQIDELENRTIPAQATDLLQGLQVRIGDFDARIAASGREMQQIPARATEERRRERNVEVAQLIYTELQRAYEQARLSELSAAPDIRLLDSAVPPTRPISEQMLMLIAGGLLAGLGLGVALAIILDRLDHRIRYPEQVTQELGLPILGAVPLLRTSKDGRPLVGDEDQLLEAVRTIRMAMLYAHGTAGPFVTTVTSPGSGDGKSFISAHLARSFAMSGRRTLLIDGDNRRGYLHKTLGIPRKPGLMDLLAGKVERADVVRTHSSEGYDVIATGTRSRVAPEMLASAAMTKLMMELRGEYQAIIVDSPPLGAGVDPLVLASLSGTMVMILRNGVTDRDLAEARLHDIERLPIRILGAVLNDVRPEGAYRYYSYLPGYSTADEDLALPVSASKRVRNSR